MEFQPKGIPIREIAQSVGKTLAYRAVDIATVLQVGYGIVRETPTIVRELCLL